MTINATFDLTSILQYSPIAQGVYSTSGEILYINQAFMQLFGYELHEIATIEAWIIKAYPNQEYAKLMKQQWLDDIDAYLEGKTQTERRVYAIRCKNGTERNVEISFSIHNNLVITAFIDCSHRMATERQLQQKEAVLWAAFNQTYQFMGILDPLGKVYRVNESALTLIGKTNEAVENQLFWDCDWWNHSIAEQEKVKDAIRRAAQGETVRMETTHPDADGQIHTVLFSIKPVYGQQGELLCLLPEGTDISEIRNASAQLRVNEERMRLAFDASLDGIFDWDFTTNHIYYSPRWLPMLGYEPGEFEMTIDVWKSMTHPDDLERVLAFWHKSIAEKNFFETRYRLRAKDGSWRQIFGRAIVARNAQGQATRVVTNTSDVTELLFSKHALEKSEQTLQTAQQIAKIGSWEIDLITHEVNCSDEAYRIFGYAPREVKPTISFISERTHPEDREALHETFWGALMQKQNFHYIYRILTPNGEMRYVQSQAHNEFAADGTPLRSIGTSQDISELEQYRQHLEYLVKQRTEELQQTNEELFASNEALYDQKQELEETLKQLHEAQSRLIQSEKMASLGILTAGIAHEINNPLNYIKSGIDAFNMLKSELVDHVEKYIIENKLESVSCEQEEWLASMEFKKLNNKFNQCSKNINTGVDKIVSIIKSLRMFSRMDNEVIMKNNLLETIGSVLIMLQSKHKNRIKIHTEFVDLPVIETYGEQLFQVLINIVSNAMDAIENEGTITISTQLINAELVSISVKDTGMGMSPETQARLFEPFFTTKKTGVGTGLGLAISYGMIERHGGRIEVQSEIGKGTQFTIILPITLKGTNNQMA